MGNSDGWVWRPDCPGIYERRLRWLRLPLTKVAVYVDMEVLVWVTKDSQLDPQEFDDIIDFFIEYRLVRTLT